MVVHLAPKSMAVLQCLVAASNTVVSRKRIFETVWPSALVCDEALTQRIAELRRAFGDSHVHPRYIETFPKSGFRLIPAAVPLDGASPAPPASAQLPETARRSGRRLVPGLLAIAAALAVAWYAVTREDPPPVEAMAPARSIAVLPFDDLSERRDQGWLADGVTEEILNALTQMPGLRVTARKSSFYFKGGDYPVAEIAERLGVDFLIEGSLRRDGDRIRITAQLIRTSDESHAWSESYDRTLENVLDVQVEIAEHVAAELGVVFDEATVRRMRDSGFTTVHAFVAYQKGLEAFARAHEGPIADRLALANAFFDEALAINPRLSSVRTLRADRASHIVVDMAVASRQERYPGEARELSDAFREELEEAWRLAPAGNQRDILNVERVLAGNDWSGLGALVETALEPGACPQFNAGELLSAFGWADRLVAKWEEAHACNPMDADTISRLAGALTWAGRAEQSLALLEQAERLGVLDRRFLLRRCSALLALDRANDPRMEECWSKQQWKVWQVLHHVLAGDAAQARELANRLFADPSTDLRQSLVVSHHIGDRERANGFAARIDSAPGSARVIAGIVFGCHCGAPFDLDATPNFKARILEAGFAWPPVSGIHYPGRESVSNR